MARILIVEDEPAMAHLLEQALSESGFAPTLARNGREGLARAIETDTPFDAIVSDVMMPGMDGFEMTRRLRSAGVASPILFLTAKDAVGDRVVGLDLGGDDYLVKPFELAELFARLRALMRRSQEGGDIRQSAGVWADARSRKVKIGDRPIYLSATEFSLLWTLLGRPGEPIAKETILREVWESDTHRNPNLVEVYVNYLRTKTESFGGPRLIHTVRGKGYVLEEREPAPATALEADAAEA